MGATASCLGGTAAAQKSSLGDPLYKLQPCVSPEQPVRAQEKKVQPVVLPPPPPPASPPPRLFSPVSNLQVFSYQQLEVATNQFSSNYVLGEGGFGMVYKGFLPKDEEGGLYPVAVKKLNTVSHQGHQEWLREIFVLGNVVHPNLVQLIGYCNYEDEHLLVYEFMRFGSLDYHLFADPGESIPLSWYQRLNIAIGAARGLAYLHARNVIHRDFKAANILLDEDFSAKLTDFGMAKEGPQMGQTHVTTAIMGTMGYLDPRYAETGRLTKKSDVYAYGVLLLELLTGRRAMGSSKGGDPVQLTNWAKPLLGKGIPDVKKLVDPNMGELFPEKVAKTLAIAAKHCLRGDAKMRPEMMDVVDTLSKIMELAFLRNSSFASVDSLHSNSRGPQR